MQFDRACDLARRNGKRLIPSTSNPRAYDLVDGDGETDIIFQKQLSEMAEDDFLEYYLDGGRYELDQSELGMESYFDEWEAIDHSNDLFLNDMEQSWTIWSRKIWNNPV